MKYEETSKKNLNKDVEFENINLICTLKKIGLKDNEISHYLNLLKMSNTEKERTLLLRAYRTQLLEEIHEKQQSLDHLDYLVYEINK